jgi:predicted metal-dependent phosphoesterase TrpH
MVDFHTHSNISDGDLSPETLIKEAVKQGLQAIALTDHDTINGLEEAKTTALAENIRFIPGIEINISWKGSKTVPGLGPGGEFHLLGLGINKPSPAFITAIKELSRRREARNNEIFNKMYELSLISDIESAKEDLKTIFIGGKQGRNINNNNISGNSLGRLHFAALLIKLKIVKNIDQAFSRYLGAGRPLFVPKEGMQFEEAASLIRESGGVSILAHPNSLYVAWGRFPDLVMVLKDMGLMGLEAWHPTAKPGNCFRLEALAKSLGIYITEGSDFHGSIRPCSRLGYSGKKRKINNALLEAIPELN